MPSRINEDKLPTVNRIPNQGKSGDELLAKSTKNNMVAPIVEIEEIFRPIVLIYLAERSFSRKLFIASNLEFRQFNSKPHFSQNSQSHRLP